MGQKQSQQDFGKSIPSPETTTKHKPPNAQTHQMIQQVNHMKIISILALNGQHTIFHYHKSTIGL